MSLRVYDLSCEGMRDPLGLDEKSPRISYKIASEEPDCFQRERRLEVASDETFAHILRDTGWEAAGETLHLPLTDGALSPATRYYYRVSVRDSLGREAISEPAFVETGLMGGPWHARWICRPEEFNDDPVVPRYQRKFRLTEAPVKARLYITACGNYRAQINGSYVSDDLLTPGWTSYNHVQQYQTYDVTDLLCRGSNDLTALVGPGWFCGNLVWKKRKNFFGERTALLCRLDMTFADGSTRRIGSGSAFRWGRSEVLSSQIYHGEQIDARLAGQKCDQKVEILSRGYGMLTGQQDPPVRAIQEIEPIEIITTPRGETVVDFGQNMVGYVRVRVRGEAGREIRLRHFEVLDRDGNAYYDNYRSALATATYVTDGKEDVFDALLTFYGFRYVTVEAFPGIPAKENFTGVVMHSDLDETNAFSCSHELLNQLQHNILWGQKGNFVDIPTDCPQRDERLGWTGDTEVFCRTACFNMQTRGFFRKWLRDARADQLRSGAIPHVIPNVLGEGGGGSAWADCITVVPTTVYRCFGDRRLLEENYPAMKKWVAYMKNWGDDPYTFCGHDQFGDWLGLDGDSDNSSKGGTSDDLVACAFYAYSVQLTADTAEMLGKHEEAARYRRLHARVRAAFNREFVSPGGRLCAGPRNQTAFVLALQFGLLSGRAKELALEGLRKSLKESKNRLTTGFAGTPFICHVLSDNGMEDLAYALVLQERFPSWLYSVTKGATTIWEHWDGVKPDGTFWSSGMNSFNHYAYGAVGDWIYRHIGGICADESPVIDPERVAYRRFTLAPTPGGGDISRASIRFESPRGPIAAEWQVEEGKVRMHLSVPANTRADFVPKNCADPGKVVILRNGRSYAAAGLVLAPGEYEVSYPLEK